MKIILLTVGKTNNLYFKNAISDYQKRLKFYISFDLEELPDIKNTKSLSEEQQKQKEGEMLLKSFQDGDEVILLDDKGSSFSSKGFASYIEKKSAFAGIMTEVLAVNALIVNIPSEGGVSRITAS